MEPLILNDNDQTEGGLKDKNYDMMFYNKTELLSAYLSFWFILSSASNILISGHFLAVILN